MDERGAGLDVHQKTVVAGVLLPDGRGGWGRAMRTCGTMAVDLLARSDGRLAGGCTQGATARTGDDWKPGCTMLEGSCEVWLVNAQPVKAVPGRKTEVTDAAGRAELWPHGLWRASFIPAVAQRERRDLTRSRSTVIQERVTLINRGQTRRADANSTLAAVASEILGGSGRALLTARLTGHADPQALAALAKGRLRSTRDPLTTALEGRVTPPHRVGLTE